jgi:hypothetical protein
MYRLFYDGDKPQDGKLSIAKSSKRSDNLGIAERVRG